LAWINPPKGGGQAGNAKSQISNTKQITMTEIQNSKCLKYRKMNITVWVIEYWNLKFICNLLARRLSGGVLVI